MAGREAVPPEARRVRLTVHVTEGMRATRVRLNSAIRIWQKAMNNHSHPKVVKRLRKNMELLLKERENEKKAEDTAT
jgi:exonuclease VII small subunit